MEMSLSQAMRLGSMMKPQHFGALFADGRTCALGAAADAVGVLQEVWLVGGYNQLRDRFPILTTPVGTFGLDLCDHILKRNDVDEWTREQIADEVETIELAQDAARVPEHLAVAD